MNIESINSRMLRFFSERLLSMGIKEGGFENLRDWFKALYETLLGSSAGPRMGSFIALYGLANSRQLIAEALA